MTKKVMAVAAIIATVIVGSVFAAEEPAAPAPTPRPENAAALALVHAVAGAQTVAEFDAAFAAYKLDPARYYHTLAPYLFVFSEKANKLNHPLQVNFALLAFDDFTSDAPSFDPASTARLVAVAIKNADTKRDDNGDITNPDEAIVRMNLWRKQVTEGGDLVNFTPAELERPPFFKGAIPTLEQRRAARDAAWIDAGEDQASMDDYTRARARYLRTKNRNLTGKDE